MDIKKILITLGHFLRPNIKKNYKDYEFFHEKFNNYTYTDIIEIIKRRMDKFLEHFEDSKHYYDTIISELLPRMAKLR